MPSQEEVYLPVWMNNDYIEETLQKEDKHLIIEKVEIEEACGKNENFASKIIRILVDVKSKKISERKSYLLKYLDLEEGVVGKYFYENGMFGREIEMYKNTIPMFSELYEKFFPGEKVAPRTTYLEKEGNKMLLMEDLSVEGYRVANRLTGLDLDHSMMVMKKFGQFHALSALLVEQNSQALEPYKYNIFYTKPCEFFFTTLLKSFALEVEHWPEYKHLVPKLNILADNYLALGTKALEPKPGEFLVLNHGDPWTSNILFNYTDTGKVLNTIFIDYQVVYHGSPIYDLCYFFATSLTYEVYANNIPLLIEMYHKSLSETLTKINYPKQIPSLEYIQQQFKEKEVILALISFSCNPMVHSQPSDNFTCEERCYKNDDYKFKRDKIFQKEAMKKSLQKRLLDFEKSGLFDQL